MKYAWCEWCSNETKTELLRQHAESYVKINTAHEPEYTSLLWNMVVAA